jgi:hypothetical protein
MKDCSNAHNANSNECKKAYHVSIQIHGKKISINARHEHVLSIYNIYQT